jgi:hypothetical protein
MRIERVLLLALLIAPGPAPAGTLRYRVTDTAGNPIPAKLTFVVPGGVKRADIDLKTKAPFWAARKGVLYTLPGEEEVPVPDGKYRVYVSHGPEWTVATADIEVGSGPPASVKAALERVIDTRGWISGDMHLHTLTNSGHGDANLEERIITLAAEEVEWAVATDHNFITDYRPYVKALNAGKWILTTVGNELTTTFIGHFNVFPLDPLLPPTNWRVSDPRELFRRIRQDGVEVIQVNHPRWTGERGAYFRDLDVSPHTGDTEHPLYSTDFDSIEVLNSGPLDGWEFRPNVGTGDNPVFDFSVREDWYHLLNRGSTVTAVGNSDSHNVDEYIGGYPRNYLRSAVDDPALASEKDLVAAVKAGRLTVSSGIFVEAWIGESLPGSLVLRKPPEGAAAKGVEPPARSSHVPTPEEVALSFRVQAPPWVRADRIIVVSNGEEVARLPLPAQADGRPLRHEGVYRDRPARDAWYVVYAIGDTAPVPILHPHTFPLGFTNAIRVDADGDGKFTPLREHARRLVEKVLLGETPAESLARETPSFRRQALGALREIEAGRGSSHDPARSSHDPAPAALRLLADFTRDPERSVRAAAASLLAVRREPAATAALLEARARTTDALERASLDFELARAGHLEALDALIAFHGEESGFRKYTARRDILELARKTRLGDWLVAESLAGDPDAGPPPARDPAWRALGAQKDSYLSFRETLKPRDKAVGFARLVVRSRVPFRTYILAGSENECSLALNGLEILRAGPGKSSDAMKNPIPVSLPEGENTILVKLKLEGEKTPWGFHLLILDPLGDIEPVDPGA